MWEERRVGDLVAWHAGPTTANAAIVVVHGGPGLSDYTAPLGELIAARAPRAQIVRYQQRGVLPPSLDGPVTVEQHVEDLATVVASLNADNIVLVGHSWGGYLVFHAVVAAPGAYAAAIAIDTLGGVDDGGLGAMSTGLRARCTDEDRARLAELAAEQQGERSSDRLARAEMEILWPHYFGDGRNAPPMPPLTVGAARAAETWISISEHMRAATLAHSLSTIDIPMLFLVGARSPLPNDASTRTADVMRHAVVRCHSTAGHFPWVEDPEWTVDEITDFLRTTVAGASNVVA